LGGTLDGDFDPAILRSALRRIVASNWPCVTEALGRNARGRDALGNQKIYYLGGSPRRQHQIVGNALLLQRRSHRQIVGIAIDDEFGVRRSALQFWNNIVGKLCLTGGA